MGTNGDGGKPRKPLMTVAQAAQLLGVARHSLYPLINQGRLQAFRAGGALRISRRQLREFLDGNRTGPPPEPPPKKSKLTRARERETQEILDRLL